VNERNDQLSGLARALDRPVAPRREFADALLARLLEELEPPAVAPSASRPRGARPRSLRFALAFALALLGVVVAAVVLNRPQGASALDVIRQARQAFASTPPFQALIKVDFNPDGANVNYLAPKGATETVLVSYGGPRRFRTEVVSQRPRFRPPFAPPPGSYTVSDGRRWGSFDPRRPTVFESGAAVSPAVGGYAPLALLSWRGASPNWDRVCVGQDSKVLADARIAGRDTRHIRCGSIGGQVWELWIDRQTGLLLKLVGQVLGGDEFLGGGISTSQKGGFEIERVRYNPEFPNGTFSVTAPAGAFDAGAAQQATLATLPPFHAVFALDNGRRAGSYVGEGWWLDERTWRSEALLDRQRGGDFTGAGSFVVQAHGSLDSYNAHDNSYFRAGDGLNGLVGDDPAQELLDYLQNDPARCPIVGHEQILGRETDHRRCARDVVDANPHHKRWATWEYWIDAATGLTLRSRLNGHDVLVVRSIEYRPHFPAGIFRFVPPPGSRDLAKLEKNPFYKTKLALGKPAPNWHATTLDGKPFQLTDLRGKPALLLLLPDWCGDDPRVCNDLAPLEQAYQKSNHRTQVVWVDIFGGTAQGAKKLARFNHLTFPIVIDHKQAVTKAWAPNGYPYWLLLDSRGRVIEAPGHQTAAQLTTMLAEGRAPS
jgi:peroxiredoxin